jgi:hypothetical protein
MKDLLQNKFSEDYRLSVRIMLMLFRASIDGFMHSKLAGKALPTTLDLKGSLDHVNIQTLSSLKDNP